MTKNFHRRKLSFILAACGVLRASCVQAEVVTKAAADTDLATGDAVVAKAAQVADVWAGHPTRETAGEPFALTGDKLSINLRAFAPASFVLE